MTTYVALLRGIAPMNPNQRNERLRRVCEDLGLRNVRTVISSGNVVFDTDTGDVRALEADLEAAWSDQLDFKSTTMIRSRSDLQSLTDADPFGGLEHGKTTYLLTTFFKNPVTVDFALPYNVADRDYRIVAATPRELYSVMDTTSAGTPDLMVWLESQFGTGLTSRTWLTVSRILTRMG